MSMKTVSVALLKQNLSRYLHMVVEGQELLVTSHQRPVARVVLPESTGLSIRPPVRSITTLRSVKGISMSSASAGLEILLEDRRRR